MGRKLSIVCEVMAHFDTKKLNEAAKVAPELELGNFGLKAVRSAL